MSQWREDRDEESLLEFLLVIGGGDPRTIRRGRRHTAKEVGIGVAIAVLISAAFWGSVYALFLR